MADYSRIASRAKSPRSRKQPKLPDRTTVTAWQWEATMLPLPEHERDRIAQWIADGTMDISRATTVLHGLDVILGEGADPIVRINNEGPPDAFILEVNRNRIMYRHESEGTADPGAHIRGVALPLLRRIADEPAISTRFITAGSAYELTSSVPGIERPNCQLAVAKLVAGLAKRPWEASLNSTTHPLERLDLKWAVDTKIRGEAASLWFKLECPSNDGYRKIDTMVVVQSPATELPSPKWAATADLVHAAVWPTVLEFMTWLFAERR